MVQTTPRPRPVVCAKAMCRRSVIFFVADRGPIPTQTLQQLTVCLDHLVEAADVGVHAASHSHNFSEMLLHVSSQAFPVIIGATECGEKSKIVMLCGEMLELLAIVDVVLATRAEKQPELTSLMTIALR